MPCQGPDKAALMAATKDSGCQSEAMVHAGMFRLVLAVMVYLCINISRILVVTAVVRLSWRSLTGRGFEFKASCNRLGEVDHDAQERLKKKVDEEVQKFERSAYLMLVLSVLVHIPYIIILNIFGKSQNP